MRYRPRWGLLTLGWIIVLILFTFPLWRTAFTGRQQQVPFAQADSGQREIFLKMPRDIALTAYASFLTVVPVPTAATQTPFPADAQIVMRAEFTAIDAVHNAEGRVRIYRQPDKGSLFMTFDNFKVTNAPGLQVYLSSNEAPKKPEELDGAERYFVVSNTLMGTTGAQQFRLPSGLLVDRYRSVVLFSEPLQMVYGYATFVR